MANASEKSVIDPSERFENRYSCGSKRSLESSKGSDMTLKRRTLEVDPPKPHIGDGNQSSNSAAVETRIKTISPTNFTFSPISSLFRQVGSLFRQVGSLIHQSLRSQVSGSPLESRRSDRTASSLPFSSAKFKIAVSLCAAGTQRMADTCRIVQRRYIILTSTVSS